MIRYNVQDPKNINIGSFGYLGIVRLQDIPHRRVMSHPVDK